MTFVPSAEAVRCPACSDASPRIVHRVAMKDRKPGILECGACGLVFTEERTEQQFSDLSDSFYYDDWRHIDLEGTRQIFMEVSAAYERNRRVPGTSVGWKPSILDVGCGAGHVLPQFRAHGWQVRGVDPWCAVARAGSKYYQLPIDDRRLEEVDLPSSAFDVLLAADVLQFIADPLAFLTRCREAARPGGLLYLTVPNFAGTTSRRDGWGWAYFVPHCYINYFSADALRHLAARAGFELVEIQEFGGIEGDFYLRLLARRPGLAPLTWSAVASEVQDEARPRLDRQDPGSEPLSAAQQFWRENGYLILPGLIPDELIDNYCRVRAQVGRLHGWPVTQPYLDNPEIKEVCLYAPLSRMLEHLIGEPMGLHLNLTGWISTERGWHQDDYLNPNSLNGYYAAAWIALDGISPDCGPFEFVPGSHRWPLVRQERILDLLGRSLEDDRWPWESEGLLSPFFEAEIVRRQAPAKRFQAAKGDVLIWHSRLVHRGARPERPGVERRGLIAHYSAVERRLDMPAYHRHGEAGWYFGRIGGTAPE